MSAEAMTDFLDRIRHDRDLAARLAVAVGAKDGEAALAALIGFAAQNGFDVTGDDAQTVRDRLQGVRGPEGELADTDLETVAGGHLPVQVSVVPNGGAVVDIFRV